MDELQSAVAASSALLVDDYDLDLKKAAKIIGSAKASFDKAKKLAIVQQTVA